MFTQTRPLLRSCIVCTRSAVCHAGVVRLSQYCQYAPLNTNSQYMPLCGAGIWQFPANLSRLGFVGFELRDLLGRTVSALQLRQLFCPAHGSVPAVLQRKAPLPPLCIMTNQGRQAAVPLAHHSTGSLPWENKLTKLYNTPLRTQTKYCTYDTQCQQPVVNQVTDREG